ncbi:AMP-binding protein [Streptomyces sp. NPDC126514]|uniref:AMP-binding protein n=1 Tax=Streptomyces sp. NPDC126514 TaxID=3155210 RepID=UPI003317A27F
MQYVVPDLLLQTARNHPWALAVIEDDQALTYCELAVLARRCAGFLAERARPGDRVALVLPLESRSLALFFGAHMAGLVPVFIHDRLPASRIGGIIEHAQAVLVVTSRNRRALVRRCSAATRRVVTADTAAGPPLNAVQRVIGPDLAALVYPASAEEPLKGVMLSHDNLLAGAFALCDCLRLTEHDRILTLPAWSSHYGLNQVLATFAAGAAVVIPRLTSAPGVCHHLTSAAVTGLALLPSLWPSLAGGRSPFLHEAYPHLRYLTHSGAGLAPGMLTAMRSAHPKVEVFALYGHPETLHTTCLQRPLIDTKPGSIGRPVPNSDVLVVDDNGRPCPPGTHGQFVHRGPTIARGYWRDPEATAAVFRPHRAGTGHGASEMVVYSGEYGYADADGSLHHAARRADQPARTG